MLIWLILLIPIAAAIIMAVFFTRKMVWWEYLLVVGIPVICIIVGKIASVSMQTQATEYWNSYATKVTYEEPWDEWITETCYRNVPCGTDADGNTKYCSESYDCSHRRYHPEEYYINDNIGETHNIDSRFYGQIKAIWKNEKFMDMHRDYYHMDGDAYFLTYKDSLGILAVIPICRPHSYENKVKATNSVFNFKKVDSADIATYKLFGYPAFDFLGPISYNYQALLGYNDPKALAKLQRYNAVLGAFKQVHMMILVFTDQPREAGQLQEAYWKGSNKNEFVLCIGQSKNHITWTKVISWTDKEKLKISLARKVRDMDTLNLEAVVDMMQDDVKKFFVRKNWHDFDYLTVEPSPRAILITFIITILVTVGISIFAVKNDFDL